MSFPEEGLAAKDGGYPITMRRWALGVVALGAIQIACAQQAAPQAGAAPPPGFLQKHVFVHQAIEDASVVKRIKESGDAEAQRLFSVAGASYTSARAALGKGDYSTASKFLDEAMSAMVKARRRVPDNAGIAVKQRAEYDRTLDSIESLAKSYFIQVKQSRQKSSSSGADTEERASLGINRLIEAAKAHAKAGDYANALQTLGKAEQVMKSAVGRVLGSTMLDYTQKFETLAEEYVFELERNRSFVDLIPVAISELKPSNEAKKSIDGLVAQNRGSIDQARTYAAQQDYKNALVKVRVGTGYLQLALSAAGLVSTQGAGAE